MAKSWNSKSEFRILSSEMSVRTGHDYQRRILPLLRILWPDITEAPDRKTWDRKGIDFLVWSDGDTFPVVVQCKGFEVTDLEMGQSQVDQCLASIVSFKKSGVRAFRYVLVHNRTGQYAPLREAVSKMLENLVVDGHAHQAELWDRTYFLNQVFNHMRGWIRQFLEDKAKVIAQTTLPTNGAPISQIPLKISRLTVNKYKLTEMSSSRDQIGDPAAELLMVKKNNITVLIGEAGYGKTTAALRSIEVRGTERSIFYLPAAGLRFAGDMGSKNLLSQCIHLDDLFGEIDDSSLKDHRLVAKPVLELLLKDQETPIILLLDGLDESLYFSMRGGLQTLFNQLAEVHIPVVLTVRTEFWLERLSDFKQSFGKIAQDLGHRSHFQTVRLIELRPWTHAEIEELTVRYLRTLKDEAQMQRVGTFLSMVRAGRYSELYGDIPERPLFLRLILETVAERDVHQTSIAKLFYEWVVLKILRDVQHPMQWGTIGRAPIVSETESMDTVVRLSCQAMMAAAAEMTEVKEGLLLLLPVCDVDVVIASSDALKRIESPTGLFLNSLLVPLHGSTFKPLQVRFGHRAYQEFFLARYLHEHPTVFQGAVIPESVQTFLNSIRKEDIA